MENNFPYRLPADYWLKIRNEIKRYINVLRKNSSNFSMFQEDFFFHLLSLCVALYFCILSGTVILSYKNIDVSNHIQNKNDYASPYFKIRIVKCNLNHV